MEDESGPLPWQSSEQQSFAEMTSDVVSLCCAFMQQSIDSMPPAIGHAPCSGACIGTPPSALAANSKSITDVKRRLNIPEANYSLCRQKVSSKLSSMIFRVGFKTKIAA